MLRLVPYGFVLFFTCASSTFPAAACSVGTPNQEGSWLITSNDIGLAWTQTDTNQWYYWFDIDTLYYPPGGGGPYPNQNPPAVGNWGPIGAPQGIRVSFIFNNVSAPGSTHCFRMWTRQSPNGCRSDLPSAWTCVTQPTPPPAFKINIVKFPQCITTSYFPINGDHPTMNLCFQGYATVQEWTFENGMIKSVLGKCLDVPGGTSVDGTLIILYDCWGGPMQKWTYQDGNLRDLHGKCLTDVQERLEIWPCGPPLNSPSQVWTIIQ
jgi:hypothetical protein